MIDLAGGKRPGGNEDAGVLAIQSARSGRATVEDLVPGFIFDGEFDEVVSRAVGESIPHEGEVAGCGDGLGGGEI